MSKGSGRRRIFPSDGIRYDEDTMMTNIEERGGSHRQTANKELCLGLRTGASPTADNHGRRYAGKGRKDDHRNWKRHTKGKQYEHNARAKERQEHHTPMSESVAFHLREKSVRTLFYRQMFNQRRSTRHDRWWSSYRNYTSSCTYTRLPPQPLEYKIGFLAFEEKVKNIQLRVKYGLI